MAKTMRIAKNLTFAKMKIALLKKLATGKNRIAKKSTKIAMLKKIATI